MKNLISKITLCLSLIGLLASCAIDPSNKVRGNGNVVSEEREVKAPFEKIKVSQGIKLFLTLEEEASIYVETDENLHEYLKTEVDEGVLKVYIDGFISSSTSKKVYISTPNIASISASSGSSVTSENIIKSENLELKSSSGSSINLNIDTDHLLAKSSSGSSIDLIGITKNYESESSSGSSIDSYELTSSIATAKASSGSRIKLFVKDELTAKASSGGNIKYKGTPEVINEKSSSGGHISQR